MVKGVKLELLCFQIKKRSSPPLRKTNVSSSELGLLRDDHVVKFSVAGNQS